MWNKIYTAIILVALTAGIASAWTSTLPSASHGTLGDNQKLELIKQNLEELRTRIDADKAIFASYTSTHS